MDFAKFVHDEFTIKNNIAQPSIVAPAIMSEAKRRSRLMYGMELRPNLNIKPVEPAKNPVDWEAIKALNPHKRKD